MPARDDDGPARGPFGPPAQPWAAESPFVGEAAAEEERAPVDPWYRDNTPFAEVREKLGEASYEPTDGASEIYPERLTEEAESLFEQPWALTAEAGSERAEGFEDGFAFEETGVIAGDNRVRVTPTLGVPWRWICKVEVKGNRASQPDGGTGVLISDRHVLTAAHVVYEASQNMQNFSIQVIPALDYGDEPFGSYSVSTKPKIPKNYDPKAQDHLDWDYALLTLQDRVGKRTFSKLGGGPLCYWGHPTCVANSVFARPDPATLNGKAVFTAGYPRSAGARKMMSAAGILHSANRLRRKMGITADTTRGQSGSPVWIVENGRHCLVGIAAGAGQQTNFVVRVTRELIRQLRAWISEDGETPTIIETEEALESPALILSYPEAEYYEPPSAKWSPEDTAEEAEEFTGFDREVDELELLFKEPLEERFDPADVPKDVADALGKKEWALALKLAMTAGWHDENELTNLIFFARHPELPIEKLDQKDPKFKQLSGEWVKILKSEIRPAVWRASENTELKVSGEYVAERDPQFVGENGKKFKELVEWAAREVDINPGLLAATLLAEWDQRSVYLSSGEVRSFLSGTDDFFAQSKQLRDNVPAFSKVRFDATKKSTNINEHGRVVTTIPFNSGKDAALATAVYLKYGEIKVRKAALKNGRDFDKLPVETRFALVRIAMAAGHGGISPEGDLRRFKRKNDKWVQVKKGERGGVFIGVASRLGRVLKGEDFLVRKNEPRRDPTGSGHITNRNATILAAQAMHLSEWFFGVPVKAAAQPELETFEGFDEETEEFYDFDAESYSIDPGHHELVERSPLEGELSYDPTAEETFDEEEFADLEDELLLESYGSGTSDLLPEEETAKGLTKKLKYLSLLPHSVEASGKDVALTPSVMDPGIYDGPEKYKIAPKLQECLMGVMNKKAFSHIRVTLVDLTKDATKPEFAGFNHKSQIFAASVPKIAAMLAAFQLRHDLRASLKQKGSKTLDELFAQVRDDWANTQAATKDKATPFTLGVSLKGKLVLVQGEKIPLGEPKAPRLESVFAGAKVGSPVTIEFESTGESKVQLGTIIEDFNKTKKGAREKLDALGFLERMRIMVGGLVPASNYATSTIVRDVGFLYIASTLIQSGLYDTNRNGGLWLGADYWGSTWRGPLGGGAAQSATAGSLAAFMTLLAQNRLVSPQGSADASALMKKEPNPTHPGIVSWFKEGLKGLKDGGTLNLVLSKLGAHSGVDDCTLIEREVDLGSSKRVLRYVAVGLRARSSKELKRLILELDRCILANNGLTPAQGGHS